jgi:hypothetical protein
MTVLIWTVVVVMGDEARWCMMEYDGLQWSTVIYIRHYLAIQPTATAPVIINHL